MNYKNTIPEIIVGVIELTGIVGDLLEEAE